MTIKQIGLTSVEAKERLVEYGLNEIKNVSSNTPLKILLRQIKNNFIIYLLFFASVVSFFVGKEITAYTILGVIFMVISTGFIQEFRSEKAIGVLKNMLVSFSTAIRDGKEQRVASSDLVPGDILILKNGEKIPADCVLLDQKELKMNESVLTGESKEVSKKIPENEEYKDENLIFMGTYIVNGKCTAKILHTGMNTRFGKIAKLISVTEKELPLENKVNKIAKYMATMAVIVSVLTGLIMLHRSEVINGEILVNVLILIIALSVAAFPEGFPVVLISALSFGAYRMAKANAVVNRMSIIETLGETTVICSDKTGTITKGEMTVKKIFTNEGFIDVSGSGYDTKGVFLRNGDVVDIKKESFFEELFNSMILCNDARFDINNETNETIVLGSGTESALLVLGKKAGISKEDLPFVRVEEIPFSSERKMMSVLCERENEQIVYSKGAIEYLLNHCAFIHKKDGIHKLSESDKEKIFKANNSMTSDSMRTLALAYKKVDSFSEETFEDNLVFIGLVGMEDPPREEVKKSIEQCKNAGIEVKMITGDNKETAIAIAKEVGLEGGLMEGYELENTTDEELVKIINSISIFARVRPEHKLRIVKALKLNGEIVTMTGDGVNDAPALKEAHIGVAMGKNGTDVSRSVADLTLKDDNFHTIVLAIKEGRTIFKNIRKFVTYQLSCNLAQLLVLFLGVLLSPLLGWQIPMLLALQILFMNLITDNLPSITLALNPSSLDIMKEKPRKNNSILDRTLITFIIFVGLFKMSLTLFSYYVSYNILNHSTEYSRTVALLTLIFLLIVSAFSFRSFRKGVLGRSLFVNPFLFYASSVSLVMAFVIIYSPLNKLFETSPLMWDGIVISVLPALFLIIIFDALKIVNKKFNLLKI